MWINLHNGSLLLRVLSLADEGWEFYVTGLVVQELEQPPWETLRQQGVKCYSLSDTQVGKSERLQKQKSTLSLADASVIVAAQALGTLMLTDERSQRKKAEELKIEVHGTLWLLEQLVAAQLIDSATLCSALNRMLAAGARFPKDSVRSLKTRYNCSE